MYDLPKIRIEVENMRYQIIHAFASHNDEIEKAVETELIKVIQDYDFAGEINQIAREVITQAVKSNLEHFFQYGEGYKIIGEAVAQTLGGLIPRAPNK